MEEMTMALLCSRHNVILLKARIESAWPGGLAAFREEWTNRREDDDLVLLSPIRSIDARGIQLRLRERGLRAGRDYALTGAKGRPELLTDGIVFERTMDIAATEYGWRVRAGQAASNVISFPRKSAHSVRLARGRDCAPYVVVRDRNSGDGSLEELVCIDPEGRLVFQREERIEHSDNVRRTGWATSCRVVRPESVPKVVVELMAERFETEESFAQWLKTKAIESELMRGGV
jgi:hypothetical protein